MHVSLCNYTTFTWIARHRFPPLSRSVIDRFLIYRPTPSITVIDLYFIYCITAPPIPLFCEIRRTEHQPREKYDYDEELPSSGSLSPHRRSETSTLLPALGTTSHPASFGFGPSGPSCVANTRSWSNHIYTHLWFLTFGTSGVAIWWEMVIATWEVFHFSRVYTLASRVTSLGDHLNTSDYFPAVHVIVTLATPNTRLHTHLPVFDLLIWFSVH